MAGKTFCTRCGLSHHPAGCKQNIADNKPRNKKIEALNILSVTTPKKINKYV